MRQRARGQQLVSNFHKFPFHENILKHLRSQVGAECRLGSYVSNGPRQKPRILCGGYIRRTEWKRLACSCSCSFDFEPLDFSFDVCQYLVALIPPHQTWLGFGILFYLGITSLHSFFKIEWLCVVLLLYIFRKKMLQVLQIDPYYFERKKNVIHPQLYKSLPPFPPTVVRPIVWRFFFFLNKYKT